MNPSSFCCISTLGSSKELIGMLLTLSIHNKNAKVYIMTDTPTKNKIEDLQKYIELDIEIINTLDKYTNKNRQQMEKEKIWTHFQMQKAEVIRYSLNKCNDTLFLDCDILIFNKITIPDNTKDIGVSPHYIKKQITDKYGYYNGGCIWVKNKDIPDKWIEYTKKSRYYDQASIEDLTKNFSYFEFPEQYNLGAFRVSHDNPQILNQLEIINKQIYYKKQPLIFIHCHFDRQGPYAQLRNKIMLLIGNGNFYKEFLCIERMMKQKWLLTIPRQPLRNKYTHCNDTFRELAKMYSANDLQFKINDSKHCWFMEKILLYDRPTLEWIDGEVNNSILLLLGNGDENEEKSLIEKTNKIVKSWIFWPRKPKLVEDVLGENKNLEYEKREIESIFMGGFTTQQQLNNRNPQKFGWDTVITEFYFIQGNKFKYSHKEYLYQLQKSKYGLCLRGFGKKCNREMELMAMGTVPIITPDVSIDYYNDKLIENKHFIRINDPSEYRKKIDSISKEQWTEMSNNCKEWYMKNIHSKNGFNQLIKQLLYN